ncbi:hypothetical protein GRX03_02370 [Halovenus sp. WSH3]|uniref:Uncharacterized protein n=1 Tax=Halovenus carboxidivorans TaxID=2692199 RepID=A0A6B0T5E6_9EURY|nr:hypothetical protein [Halovenus carboxidivorans]MXR50451.1 hypothetical protein [Halovenus carboxidivorans]
MPERQPEYIQLTSTELGYLERSAYPERSAYIRGLLNGEYNYTVVAEFESGRSSEVGLEQIARSGLDPTPAKFTRRIVILQRVDAED